MMESGACGHTQPLITAAPAHICIPPAIVISSDLIYHVRGSLLCHTVDEVTERSFVHCNFLPSMCGIHVHQGWAIGEIVAKELAAQIHQDQFFPPYCHAAPHLTFTCTCIAVILCLCNFPYCTVPVCICPHATLGTFCQLQPGREIMML